MRNPQGYLVGVGEGVEEFDTFTCNHCNRIVTVPHKGNPSDLGGHCRLCDALVCNRCVGKGCTPWEKQMEKMEAREAALRSYGL